MICNGTEQGAHHYGVLTVVSRFYCTKRRPPRFAVRVGVAWRCAVASVKERSITDILGRKPEQLGRTPALVGTQLVVVART
jgi:hypothetical protein